MIDRRLQFDRRADLSVLDDGQIQWIVQIGEHGLVIVPVQNAYGDQFDVEVRTVDEQLEFQVAPRITAATAQAAQLVAIDFFSNGENAAR